MNNLFYTVFGFYVIYFPSLSVTWVIQQHMIDELEGIWKNAVMS